MSNKTISINPSLFSIGGLKTKKNREKKVKSTVVPLISPNVLKKKLLNRIREHKNKEIKNLHNKTTTDSNKTQTKNDNNQEKELFSDEFHDSINYLQTLTKQKKINEEKEKYELQKQKRKQELERKTVRNYSSITGGSAQPQPVVNIELPEELSEPILKVNTEQFTPNIQLKPYSIDNIPYGILKGGQKITYRNWSKNQNNGIPNNNLTIQGGQPDKQKSERENRLGLLREKLKNKQIEQAIKLEEQNKITNSSITPSLLQTSSYNTSIVNNSIELPVNTENPVTVNIGGGNPHEKIIGTKKIIKKTIKKKYTLGKSKIKKMVGVLIKDRGTRKQVLTAQKDLKRKTINEVKSYLRDHNLLKAGSNAPNDVVRKLYESAMLAGDITNSNTEILLHNFSKDDKEL
jgi:hypothetical protein